MRARDMTLTSETVRNTSGLSSVVILFTESEWHRIVLCFQPGRVGDPLTYCEEESNVVISAPTSKTLTKPSRAAVALYNRVRSSVYGPRGKTKTETVRTAWLRMVASLQRRYCLNAP